MIYAKYFIHSKALKFGVNLVPLMVKIFIWDINLRDGKTSLNHHININFYFMYQCKQDILGNYIWVLNVVWVFGI